MIAALLGLVLSAGAPDAGGAAAAKDDGPLPASVEELFAEEHNGKPILGGPERAALGKLPAHTRELIGQKVDVGTISGADHLKLLLSLELSPQAAGLVFADNCLLCHSSPEQKRSLRFSLDPRADGSPEHLDLKNVLSDVHFRRGLSCAGCHGGEPFDDEMGDLSDRWPARDVRRVDRTWIPDFCARCHSDPVLMRGFNPALPTDQLAKYRDSKHGQLLLRLSDSKAAQCVSCHGVHGIRGPRSRQSTVHPQAIPATCGKCHGDKAYMAEYETESGEPLPTDQVEQYKSSVHGKALLEKGDLGAPACNDCHGNHAAMPPAVSTVSQICRTCHAMNGTLFDGSRHKRAFEKHRWPECEQCHGKHGIAKPTDAWVSDAKGSLCGDCHARHSDDPACNEGARYFRATLDELTARAKTFPSAAEHRAERGLDTEPIVAAIGEVDEAIVQTRTRVHTFDKGGFDVGAEVGREAVAKVDRLLEAAREEEQFRLNGLLVAIGFMSLVAVTLWLKIRELDQRRAAENAADQRD